MPVEEALHGVDRRLRGGERVGAAGGARLTTVNPTTGGPLAKIDHGSPVVVRRAPDPVRSRERDAGALQRQPDGPAAGRRNRDVGCAHRVAGQIRADAVWINTYNDRDPAAPFGGSGATGFGRTAGAEAARHYTHLRNVWVRLD